MKKPLNHSILIVIGAVIMVMVVYVYIVGQFTGGPLDSSSAGRTGRTLQQLQSPGAEQPSNEQPSGAGQSRTAPENQADAENQTGAQVPAAAQTGISPQAPAQTVKPAEGVELKTWTGIYTGRLDNNFIEIKVGDEARTFLAPAELIGGTLKKDDPVIFDFYKNDSGQLVLVSFKKMNTTESNP
jgi:hypothetical protein